MQLRLAALTGSNSRDGSDLRRPSRVGARLGFASLALSIGLACAPAAAPGPTSVPAKPAEQKPAEQKPAGAVAPTAPAAPAAKAPSAPAKPSQPIPLKSLYTTIS